MSRTRVSLWMAKLKYLMPIEGERHIPFDTSKLGGKVASTVCNSAASGSGTKTPTLVCSGLSTGVVISRHILAIDLATTVKAQRAAVSG